MVVVNRHRAPLVRLAAALLAVSVGLQGISSRACDCPRPLRAAEHGCCPAPAVKAIGASSSCCRPQLAEATKAAPSREAAASGIAEAPTLHFAKRADVAGVQHTAAGRARPPAPTRIVLRI